MRRLRSCLASTGSGGRRRPSAPTTRGCASARDGAGERRRKPSGWRTWASLGEDGDAPVPTRSGPPVQNRRDGAPEGDADQRRLAGRRWAATCYSIAPVGAPSPLGFARGTPEDPVCAAARCRRRVGAIPSLLSIPLSPA